VLKWTGAAAEAGLLAEVVAEGDTLEVVLGPGLMRFRLYTPLFSFTWYPACYNVSTVSLAPVDIPARLDQNNFSCALVLALQCLQITTYSLEI
jgi:hypothetical protein